MNQQRAEHESQRTTSFRSPEVAEGTPQMDFDSLLELQRTVGNQAIQRLIAGGHLNLATGLVQAKLTVGEPDDVYEQEAESVASRIMTMPEPVQREALPEEEELQLARIQREALPEEEELQLARIQREALPEEEELQLARIQREALPEEEALQMQSATGAVPEVNSALEDQIESLRGAGQAMPDTARQFFEPRFGQDFTGVHIHTGTQADQLNRQLEARAFTTGQDIFFRQGEYNPGSSAGRELLAHELTHVVQQGGSAARDDDRLAQPSRLLVQRFDTPEHDRLGNQATQGPHGEAQMVALADDYRLTYGEMVAMAGDFFESIDQMRQLATNPGSGPGTRAELEYVRVVKVNKGKDTFDESVKAAVDKRYYQLAMNNRSHFLNPEKGDTGRSTDDKADDAYTERKLRWAELVPNLISIPVGFEQVWVLPSSGAAYRRYHVRALNEAYEAGAAGESIDEAMAVEAFGNHYLTDAFAGGHLRTPRTSINEHWNKRVPMFNYNLKGYMAEQVARNLNDNYSVDLRYHGLPPLRKGALALVTEAVDAKGLITFGDVISGAIHDYDNERGVSVTIGVGGPGARLFGDGHLGQGDEASYATQAIKSSQQDVAEAYEAGKKGVPALGLIARLLGGGQLFSAELLLPQVKPDSEVGESDRSVKWDYNTVDELLNDGQFAAALKLFTEEKAQDFETVAESGEFSEDQKAAIISGVVKPLRAKPVEVIRSVINWTPNTGGGVFGHNQDDNALDYYEEAKKANALDTLTTAQKVAIINNLCDGVTTGDEETAIYELVNANPADVKQVIQAVGWEKLEDEVGGRFSKKYPQAEYQ